MFYCKTKKGTTHELLTDKSASIVAIKLHTDIHANCIDIQSRQHIDALTTRNFHGYRPPLNETGNVFALAWNELPQAKQAFEYNHLRGEITTSQDWYPGDEDDFDFWNNIMFETKKGNSSKFSET